MLNHGLRAIVSVVFATAFALFTRADAMMVSNPASVMAALTTTNFAQPEQIRGFSCNLPSYCSFPNTAYGRVHSRASNRFYYESCRCERRSETIRSMATRLSPAIPKQSN